MAERSALSEYKKRVSRQNKSHNRGELVQCKCPVCDVYHFVVMGKQPVFMPRIYCKQHERLREEE